MHAIDFSRLITQQAFAYGKPDIPGRYRDSAADFRVDEILGFEPDGEGDHLLIRLQKTGLNTTDVIARLVRQLGVKQVDIGYCGLKDRKAITSQWFSVHVPGRVRQTSECLASRDCLGEGVRVLHQVPHRRKLRTGSHRANRFVLRVAVAAHAQRSLADRLSRIQRRGFPNYFGEQRFGHHGRNIDQALVHFTSAKSASTRRGGKSRGKAKRGLYLSAARAFIFNQLLSARIESGSWLTPQHHEPLMLSGSRSFFVHQHEPDDTGDTGTHAVVERLANLDIHTSGILWGRFNTPAPLPLELDVADQFGELARGLERAGMQASRRALRAIPRGLRLSVESPDHVLLAFELDAGVYATALLRELIADC